MLVIPNRVNIVAVMSALALVVGLLTLALPANPAQSQAETITTNDHSTFNQLFTSSCTGEVFFVQGTLHTVAHTTIDETGVIHTKYRIAITGQGESDSGAKYVLHDAFNAQANVPGAAGEQFNATSTTTHTLIRQGSPTPTDDVQIKLLSHVTLNDHGELTAEVFKMEAAECT
jgi:hypothetical protein